MLLFFGSSGRLFKEVESCLSAMCSMSIGWFVRGITPSVGKLMVQDCVVVDFVTQTLPVIHYYSHFSYYVVSV